MQKSKLFLCLVLALTLLSVPFEKYAGAVEEPESDAGSSLFVLNEQGFFAQAFSKTIDLNGPLEYSPLATFMMQIMTDEAKATLASLHMVGDIYESASVTFYPDGKAWLTYKLTDAAYEAFKSVNFVQNQSASVVSNSYMVDVENSTVKLTKDDAFTMNMVDGSLSRTSALVQNESFSEKGEVVDPPAGENPPLVAYTVMKDISYGIDESDVNTKMDVFVPRDRDVSKNNGAFLIIYGGGWTSGTKEGMESVAAPFASAGYVTVAINMRNVFINETTKETEVTVYDMITNVHDSIKKLKELSNTHGWNIKEIALFGGSSGANIAMNYAYSRGSDIPYFDTNVILPVKFVVQEVGPVDMHESAWYGDENWPDRNVMTVPGAGPLYAMLLTGAASHPNLTDEEKEAYIKSMSPVHYVQTNGGLPTVMGYSKVDYIQNPNNGKTLKGYLDNKNIRNDLFTFPKSIHGYYADPEEAEKFFDKSLEYAEKYFNGTTTIVDFKVTSTATSTITFNWPTALRGATKLIIEQSPAGQKQWTTSATGSIATDATSATVTGLTPGKTFDFRLVITGGANTGSSNIVSAMTNSVVPEIPTNPPSAGGNTIGGNSDLAKFGTTSTTERDGQMVTTLKFDSEKMKDILAIEGQSAAIKIPMIVNSDIAAIELNGQSMVALGDKNAVLELRTDRAVYKLPAQQIIGAVSDQMGIDSHEGLNDVNVQIEIAKPEANAMKIVDNAANAGKLTIIAPPIEFTVRAIRRDKVFEITRFNTYVERSIAIPDDVDPKLITTGIVAEPDGTVRHVPTKIVVEDGKYYAQINSLTNSVYALVSHPIVYSDMSNHWAEDAVYDMGSRMILDGTIDEQFSPDQDITRAEFVSVVTNGLGLKKGEGNLPLADVSEFDDNHDGIQTAYAYHLITGFEDGTFRPKAKITREEAMVILSKAMKITGLKSKLADQSTAATSSPYADFSMVSKWALGGVMDCLQAGIVSGRNNSVLAPHAFLTKAEAITIVRRLLQKSELI